MYVLEPDSSGTYVHKNLRTRHPTCVQGIVAPRPHDATHDRKPRGWRKSQSRPGLNMCMNLFDDMLQFIARKLTYSPAPCGSCRRGWEPLVHQQPAQ